MRETLYTVKVDDQSIEQSALGPYSAVSRAMSTLNVAAAAKVQVISGEGERTTYLAVRVINEELGLFTYERKD